MNETIHKSNGNVNTISSGSLVPRIKLSTLDDLEKFCKMTAAGYAVAKKLSYAGKKIPAELTDPDFIFIIVSNGAEIGLKPMQSLHNISLIDGKPVLWGDGMLAVVRNSGELEEFNESFSNTDDIDSSKSSRKDISESVYIDSYCAICSIKRKGYDRVVYKFSVGDAKAARLWTFDSKEPNKQYSPWFKYPKRMLQMRARSWALRDTFADSLKGFSTVEEARDINQTYEAIEDTTPAEVYKVVVEETPVLIDPSGEGRQDSEGLNEYINEIMASTKQSHSAVVKRANANFETFFSRFKEWADKSEEEEA